MTWQLQEAKAKFSELVQTAIDRGPQTVSRHGKEVVVVISVAEYERLKARQTGFKEFLASAPLEGVDLERNRDYGRDIDL